MAAPGAAAAMACLSTACLAAPRIANVCSTSTSTSSNETLVQSPLRASFATKSNNKKRSVALRAGGSSGVEPDLEEDYRDTHETAGMEMEDYRDSLETAGMEMEIDGTFPWGKADGAHSWHEGDDGTWWEGIKEVFESSGGPTGAQGAISWLFLPGLAAGVYFDVNQDYLFLYTVLFIFAFIGMEMAKPSKPSHFEPDVYKLKEKKRV